MQKMSEKEAIIELKRSTGCGIYKGTADVAIQALEEIQQYRAIETELKERYHANVDIKMLMQYFIETIFEGEKHEGFRILTNEDAKMWDTYKAIGTVDQCREAVERMKPKRIKNTPNDECPTCGRFVMGGDHCRECGQKVDWSE